MNNIVGVKFNDNGKTHYFEFDAEQVIVGDMVIAQGNNGLDCGKVIIKDAIKNAKKIEDTHKIIRKATKKDLEIYFDNCEKEKQAAKICKEKIQSNGLDMKLIEVKYTFDKSKLLFYFSAENRVDFRNLVKELAAIFKVRIELRQVGVRDEARALGGLGICGKPFCCSTFLNEFQPVSIKMAKEQGLSLNPVKISGTCGRLMCCLKYEQDVYSEILKEMPKIGSTVSTSEGTGAVVEQNVLKSSVKVKLDKAPESLPTEFSLSELKKSGK